MAEKWAVSAGYTYLDSEIVDAGFVNTGSATAPNYQPSPNNGNQVQNVWQKLCNTLDNLPSTPTVNRWCWRIGHG